MQLIEDGELSHKDVIEELINNGVLPVEVTQIGKIPIIVGGRPQLPPPELPPPSTPTRTSAPLRKLPNFESQNRPREEVNLARLQQLKVQEPQMVMRDHHDIMTEVGLDDPDSDFEMLKHHRPRGPRPTPAHLLRLEEEIATTTTNTPETKDIEILSSMMDLYDQGMISEEELEQMVIMMEAEGVLDVDLEELGLEEKRPSSPRPPKQYPGFSYGLSPENGAGPSRPSDVFGFKSRPLIEPKEKPVSYAHFSMAMGKGTTPLPPELPPPSTESVHNAPFFEELKMDNPFKDPFEKTFANADLEFKPRPTPSPASEGLNDVRPGPAPPYYMAARLPAPPKFQPSPAPPPTVTEVPFLTDEEVQPLRMRPLIPENRPGQDPIFEMFEPQLEHGPREPFPPPGAFKRHTHQPLPLVLRRDKGTGFSHPHFDIPASLIDPKEYMRHPEKVPISPHASFEDAFLRRKGRRMDHQGFGEDFVESFLPAESRISLTGYRPVDRKLDEIRQSFLKGDSLGSMSLE